MKLKLIITILCAVVLAWASYFGYKLFLKYSSENAVLKEMISRLEARSRVAEVLVTGVNYNEQTGETLTTIKFLEYDVDQKPLSPKYFTFTGNIIQFQSLVIRFDDIHIRNADRLKGKSAFVFWKVFMLDGQETQEYEINRFNSIPPGYKIPGLSDAYEQKLWKNFWQFALDPKQAKDSGIRNAQIEAPGTLFIPGHLYTIKIEHDGGILIEASPLSPILQGEKIIG